MEESQSCEVQQAKHVKGGEIDTPTRLVNNSSDGVESRDSLGMGFAVVLAASWGVRLLRELSRVQCLRVVEKPITKVRTGLTLLQDMLYAFFKRSHHLPSLSNS